MTSPRELDRRVHQNRHDIDELYKLQAQTDKKVDKIAEVQQEHGADLGSILQTLEGRETSLSLQSQSLSGMKHSMKRLEGNQRKQNERLDSHGEKLDSHRVKLDEILGLLRQGQ